MSSPTGWTGLEYKLHVNSEGIKYTGSNEIQREPQGWQAIKCSRNATLHHPTADFLGNDQTGKGLLGELSGHWDYDVDGWCWWWKIRRLLKVKFFMCIEIRIVTSRCNEIHNDTFVPKAAILVPSRTYSGCRTLLHTVSVWGNLRCPSLQNGTVWVSSVCLSVRLLLCMFYRVETNYRISITFCDVTYCRSFFQLAIDEALLSKRKEWT
jgi:hypothetical protein